MRAAFLIRCSTKKQDYERQVNDLTRLAKKFGYTSSDNMIFGEHITGKDDASKRDRQSIQRLKDAAINKEFDVVLVSEVSRMSLTLCRVGYMLDSLSTWIFLCILGILILGL